MTKIIHGRYPVKFVAENIPNKISLGIRMAVLC